MFGSAAEARKAGWFSRRHETREEHDASRRTSKDRKDQRRQEANDRQDAREARTDEEQLEVLKQRGCGSCAEANRLRDKIVKR